MEKKLEYFYSVGSKQAQKLIERLLELNLVDKTKVKNDAYSIGDLRKILKNKKIFSELPEALQIDLKYDPLRRIPRPLIELIEKEFLKYVRDVKFTIAGSYIRGKNSSGDIDMVLSTEPLASPKKNANEIWEYFKNKVNQSKYIHLMPPFAQGDSNVVTLVRVTLNNIQKADMTRRYPEFKDFLKKMKSVYAKIDIFTSSLDEYMYALLYAIGSGTFNLRMRAIAKNKGYFLNQHGLFKKISDGVLERVPILTEKDIFKVLGMTYHIPSERNA